ncbi:MAG TPA: hypothetical protein VGO00_13165 [Kofleriaceae bacterium]|nr:hypothetical protein [Kofleriaceae bacterium]
MKLAVVIALVACSGHKRDGIDDDLGVQVPISHRETCGAVAATWTGERSGGFEHYSSLTLEAAGASKRWSLDEAIPAFDIFAPDCQHVLLLQSARGPYHVVAIDHVAGYLAGAAPDQVLEGHRDGHWLSNTEVSDADASLVVR